MKIRDHIFALSVHAGILLCIGILVMATSCEEPPPPPPEPDPVADFFKEVDDAFDDASAETVIVISVVDNADAGDTLVRQVFQEIQTQIDNLDSVSMLEHPPVYFEELFAELEIVPKEGISPEKAMDLAVNLTADAMVLASIESDAPDVHLKIYAAETGAVVFAETLQAWPLPVTDTEPDSGLLLEEPAGPVDE